MFLIGNSNDYIENLVSDEELFFDEISEQIEKRIMRQKTGKINKNDLIKSKNNIYLLNFFKKYTNNLLIQN